MLPAHLNTPICESSSDQSGFIRKSSSDQSGFTLVEVLVVCVLLAFVLGAIMTPMVTSARVQRNDANWAYAQQQARTGLDGMVSQIRQAWEVLATSDNSVEMNVNLNGTAELVYYECDVPQPGSSVYRECVRVQAPAGSALPPLTSGSVVIQNLTNGTSSDPVFTFGPDPVAPSYMTATVKVPASGGTNSALNHSIVFSSGALMRNEKLVGN